MDDEDVLRFGMVAGIVIVSLLPAFRMVSYVKQQEPLYRTEKNTTVEDYVWAEGKYKKQLSEHEKSLLPAALFYKQVNDGKAMTEKDYLDYLMSDQKPSQTIKYERSLISKN